MRWISLSLVLLVLTVGLVAAAFAGTETPHPPDLAPIARTAGPPQRDLTLPTRSLAAPLPATNDDCNQATEITLNDQYAESLLTTGTTISTTDPIQTCSWGDAAVNDKSVWWRITVPEDGRLTFQTISENPARYDTVVTIYPASVACSDLGPVVEIGCDDDSSGFQSRASALVNHNSSYLVEVTGWGSVNDGGELDVMAFFETDTRWQYPAGSGLPIPLTRHVTASDGRYLYAIGGQSSGLSRKTLRYDPRANLWLALPDMPISYSNTDGAYLDGYILIPSGYSGGDDGTAYNGTHYAFALNDNSWSTRAPMTDLASVSEPIAWGAAVADPAGDAYYYSGGRITDNIAQAELLRYDANRDSWQALPPMSTPRYGHQAEFVNGKLCVAGGYGGTGNILSSAECYDFGSQSWAPIAPLVIPRASFGSAVGANGRWYLFGGTLGDGLTTPKTEVYDPADNSWTVLDQHHSLHQSRDGLRGEQIGVQLFAAGGYINSTRAVVSTLEWLLVGAQEVHLPLVSRNMTDGSTGSEPNDAIPYAYGPLASGTIVQDDFCTSSDREDFFFFQLSAQSSVTITLTDIPAGSNFDLFLYGEQAGDAKTLLAASNKLADQDEKIELANMPAGTYYIRVRNQDWASIEPYSLQLNYRAN